MMIEFNDNNCQPTFREGNFISQMLLDIDNFFQEFFETTNKEEVDCNCPLTF